MKSTLLVLSFATAAIAQDVRVVETKMGDAKERIVFHKNGKKKVQVLLKKNKAGKWVPDGVVRTWYPSGNRRAIQQFRRGVKDGKWKSYYDNGKQYNSIQYKNGKIVGEARHWYDTGTLQSVDTFTRRKGDLHVSHVAYHPNGKIREKGEYIRKAGTRKSLKTGRWKYFDKKGEVVKQENYVDGKASDG